MMNHFAGVLWRNSSAAALLWHDSGLWAYTTTRPTCSEQPGPLWLQPHLSEQQSRIALPGDVEKERWNSGEHCYCALHVLTRYIQPTIFCYTGYLLWSLKLHYTTVHWNSWTPHTTPSSYGLAIPPLVAPFISHLLLPYSHIAIKASCVCVKLCSKERPTSIYSRG